MKLLAYFDTPKAPATCAGRVVLYERDDNALHPFVTWWENTELGGRCWGHYFETREEAEADFAVRAKRGY